MRLDHLLSKELDCSAGRRNERLEVDLPQAGSNDIFINARIRTEGDISGEGPTGKKQEVVPPHFALIEEDRSLEDEQGARWMDWRGPLAQLARAHA